MLREEEFSNNGSTYLGATADTGIPKVLQRLSAAANIRFDGDAPWDIQVKSHRLYRHILTKGSLGFGEAYMNGIWDADKLDETITRILRADVDGQLNGWMKLRLLADILRQNVLNLQSPRRAFQIGERHYDIGNDIFSAMLDRSMNYSCGYWEYADSLDQAQHDKMDMICRKLDLQPGEKLLEIGCGWGGLARHAAKYYKAEVTGITVSKEQLHAARRRCAGLSVDIRYMDYRELDGNFDKLVSVGMFEHVGPKNYTTYFDTATELMKDGGLFLLHTIGIHATSKTVDPWINKYIFPNGKLPSAKEIASAIDNRLVIEDWHNFGHDYDRTLMAWWDNFQRAWSALKGRYDQRFYRMWKYYLLSCAGFFRSRQGHLWQIVLSKRQRTGIYRSIR